jgi:hypothetical protein
MLRRREKEEEERKIHVIEPSLLYFRTWIDVHNYRAGAANRPHYF